MSITFTTMPMINRKRGSLETPAAHTVTDPLPTGQHPAWHEEKVYKYIADRYEKHGIGVWQYKPCFAAEVIMSATGVQKGLAPCSRCWDGAGFNPVCPSYPTSSIGYERVPDYEFQNDLNGPDHVVIPAYLLQRVMGSFESKLPSIKTGAPDMFVYVSELRDIVTTFNFLKAGNLIQKAAGGLLSWSFGVKPTFTEAAAFKKAVGGWKDRIDKVKKGLGKVHDLTTTAKNSTFTDLQDKQEYLSCPKRREGTCCPKYGCPIRDVPKRTAETLREKHKVGMTAKYRYTWPNQATVENNSLIGFLATNGLLPTVDSYYEMIPFSFVLDWVVNTKKIRRSPILTGIGNFDCEVELLDVCFTYKHSYVRRKHIRDPWDNVSRSLHSEKFFYRWTGEDALDARDWVVKLPTFMQILLGASLVAAT